MIAEKLERIAAVLEKLSTRTNDDLREMAPLLADTLRAELERVRGLEETCVLTPAGAESWVPRRGRRSPSPSVRKSSRP